MTSDLKEAREQAGYTIEEVASKLNIRRQYLINLEEENYEGMPGQVYVDGYIRMYHEFLGLPLPKKQLKEINRTKIPTGKYTVSSKSRKITIIITVSLLVIVLFAYNTIIHKPEAKISSDTDRLEYNSTIIIDELTANGNNQESFN